MGQVGRCYPQESNCFVTRLVEAVVHPEAGKEYLIPVGAQIARERTFDSDVVAEVGYALEQLRRGAARVLKRVADVSKEAAGQLERLYRLLEACRQEYAYPFPVDDKTVRTALSRCSYPLVSLKVPELRTPAPVSFRRTGGGRRIYAELIDTVERVLSTARREQVKEVVLWGRDQWPEIRRVLKQLDGLSKGSGEVLVWSRDGWRQVGGYASAHLGLRIVARHVIEELRRRTGGDRPVKLFIDSAGFAQMLRRHADVIPTAGVVSNWERKKDSLPYPLELAFTSPEDLVRGLVFRTINDVMADKLPEGALRLPVEIMPVES